MKQFQLLPPPHLYPFIDRLWGWESEAGEQVLLPHLLPGTGAEFFLHYRQPFSFTDDAGQLHTCPAAHLMCLRQQTLTLQAQTELGFVAVRFRSGMFSRFTPQPVPELNDRITAAEDLWPSSLRPDTHQLIAAGNGPAIAQALLTYFSSLQNKLHDKLQADALCEAAIGLLYQHAGDMSITTLAEQLHLGRRQLERRVLKASGLSPAEFRGLSRFHKTVRNLVLHPARDLLQTALDQGYYDQAHFNHDFRQRTGASPSAYLNVAAAMTHFYNPSRPAKRIMTTPSDSTRSTDHVINR